MSTTGHLECNVVVAGRAEVLRVAGVANSSIALREWRQMSEVASVEALSEMTNSKFLSVFRELIQSSLPGTTRHYTRADRY